MDLSEPLEFESEVRRQIYEYVESHGAVRPEEVWEAVEIDPEEFNHEVAVLKRDGYLVEEQGRFRLALAAAEAEEFTDAGVSYTVRPAREADLGGVVGAIRSVAQEGTDIVAESVAEQLEHDEALLRHNDLDTRMVFVAVVDGDVVGWAHVEAQDCRKLSDTAELTVGVLEEYRGHGMGSHLLERGLEWAGAGGFRKVYDSLPASNPDGIAFLLERGWAIEAVRADHYNYEGQLLDEVMLARDLPG